MLEGAALTVIALLDVAVHPNELVVVTVYVPAVPVEIQAVVCPELHKYVNVPCVAHRFAVCPGQIVPLLPVIATDGVGFTVIVLLHDAGDVTSVDVVPVVLVGFDNVTV